MAQKYTISKVLTQTSTNKGFTLIELIVGMMITLIVGGLAMDAFVNASGMFSKDKKTIDASQNLSAILQIIGDDIKQSGEQISTSNFPVIEITPNTVTINSITSPSSTITVRRALTQSLTLCENIEANTTPTELVVADTARLVDTAAATPLTAMAATPNCNPVPLQSGTATPILPNLVREARNYRCKLDDINDSTNPPPCQSPKPTTDLEQVSGVIYDAERNFRTFKYLDEEVTTADTKFKIKIAGLASQTTVSSIGTPIYLIEERVYRLDNDGSLKVAVNGGAENTLIKGIAKFKVSARLYSDPTTRAINAVPPDGCATDTSYACKFEKSTSYNWKSLAGVKVELQAKYNGSGDSATPTEQQQEKLRAEAEFFPRNVLSK